MDPQSLTVVELEDDDLEQVRLPIRSEEKRSARFVISFLERVAGERMFDCVNDVFIRDAVLARCTVNVHTTF